MTRYLLLGVAMFSLTTLAQASSGTIGFSGRIVDPGCDANLALAENQLHLERCPLAAQGVEVSVALSNRDSAAPRGSVLATHALTRPAVDVDARVFSQSYRVQTLQHVAAANSYQVLINYP